MKNWNTKFNKWVLSSYNLSSLKHGYYNQTINISNLHFPSNEKGNNFKVNYTKPIMSKLEKQSLQQQQLIHLKQPTISYTFGHPSPEQ